MDHQKETGTMLGDALIDLGMITRSQLDDYFRSSNTSLSGERMVQHGIVTPDQLMSALEFQLENGGRLGNIVIALGFASKDQVEDFFKAESSRTEVRLGDRLIERGLISAADLDRAIQLQKNSGGMLGEVLVSLGYVEPEALYDVLAAQMGIGRTGQKINFEDSKQLPYRVAYKYNAVIINTRPDAYIVAVREPLTKEALAEIESYLDRPIEQVLATAVEIDNYWEAVYQFEEIDESVFKLSREQPKNSAIRTLSMAQRIGFIVIIIGLIAFLVLDYSTTLLVLNIIAQVIYATLTILKLVMLYHGHRDHSQLRFTPEEIKNLDERDLPVYTLLIPVYHEASVVPLILKRLNDLDYPTHKLDIRVLLEEDDVETIEAFRTANLPAHYTLLVVPDTQPRTKPKACNYGLLRARGEYVVIYDAEDLPEPDQLKKVVRAFQELPESYVCLQAKLNYYNSNQNMLTRWFTHEYSTWFDILLPGIMDLDAPIPLGGTSNHFKTEVLREMGAWDPFNVTEDADLGIRLFKLQYHAAVIDSYTFEEANSKLGNWIRQRSRWLKGYLQTWLVHMRNPVKLYKELGGLKSFTYYQAILLGNPLIPLLNPVFWVLMVLWYVFYLDWIPAMFPNILYYIGMIQLLLGNFVFVYSHILGSYTVVREGEERGSMHLKYDLILSAILLPIYWILVSVAAYKALFQLIFRPHYWEKTTHGLTQQVTQETYRVGDQEGDGNGKAS